MINEFWNLVVETWEQGIRGVGVDDIIICLVIVISSLLARSLMTVSYTHLTLPTNREV